MLTIPDVRQVADWDCGAACVAALFRFYGLPPAAWVGKLANPIQGMSPDTAEALLRAAGLAVLSGSMTLPDLTYLTRSGRPVMTPIQSERTGHWVIVRGVSRGRVHFHCPTDGPRRLPALAWVDRWHDTTRFGVAYVRYGIATAPEELRKNLRIP